MGASCCWGVGSNGYTILQTGNLAIGSKLRGCATGRLRVNNVLLSGGARPRTTALQNGERDVRSSSRSNEGDGRLEFTRSGLASVA